MTNYDQQFIQIEQALAAAIELANQVHEGLLVDLRAAQDPLYSIIETTGLRNMRILEEYVRRSRDIAIGVLGRLNTMEAMAASAPTPGHGHDHSH